MVLRNFPSPPKPHRQLRTGCSQSWSTPAPPPRCAINISNAFKLTYVIVLLKLVCFRVLRILNSRLKLSPDQLAPPRLMCRTVCADPGVFLLPSLLFFVVVVAGLESSASLPLHLLPLLGVGEGLARR